MVNQLIILGNGFDRASDLIELMIKILFLE